LNQDKNERDILNELFEKKEVLYLFKVFGLSILLFILVANIFNTNDEAIAYFLSLISSVLIAKGYNEVKGK
jgi:predicted membrane protein